MLLRSLQPVFIRALRRDKALYQPNQVMYTSHVGQLVTYASHVLEPY
ncbi:nesp008 [Neophasia sp. alphabaculovirus]|nr:nesp008 [Neophasia sp. alphabaculovirus]